MIQTQCYPPLILSTYFLKTHLNVVLSFAVIQDLRISVAVAMKFIVWDVAPCSLLDSEEPDASMFSVSHAGKWSVMQGMQKGSNWSSVKETKFCGPENGCTCRQKRLRN
jgi:hypothetical protein